MHWLPLLDPIRVSRVLGVEVETLSSWRRKGYGPRWYRIGRKIKYAEPDLLAWMSAQACPRIQATEPASAKEGDRDG